MTRLATLLTLLLIAFQAKADCNGPFKSKTPTPEELQNVLAAHHEWVKAKPDMSWDDYLRDAGDDPKKANLCMANLGGANLRGANLTGANLTWADLTGDLTWADLTWAHLTGANLRGTDLRGANLRGADLTWADLTGANLTGANLTGANLRESNLTGANLRGADLTGADLHRADLHRADLRGGANLSGANLNGADLAEASFAPNADKLPNIASIAFANNLDKMMTSPASLPALSKLREAFKNDGFRNAERTMTYLEKQQQEKDMTPVERWFTQVLLNRTCGYGLYPGRCLQILFALVLLLSPVYLYALCRPKGGGLWAIWSPDRVDKAEGQAEPVRLSFAQPMPLSIPAAKHCDPLMGLRQQPQAPRLGLVIRFLRFIASLLQAGGIAFYFSLLSAFHFGWRDLNVGNWIARVQPREYALRPTGWVRIVSGLQSLGSVYLVALWVLSYFGRPFE